MFSSIFFGWHAVYLKPWYCFYIWLQYQMRQKHKPMCLLRPRPQTHSQRKKKLKTNLSHGWLASNFLGNDALESPALLYGTRWKSGQQQHQSLDKIQKLSRAWNCCNLVIHNSTVQVFQVAQIGFKGFWFLPVGTIPLLFVTRSLPFSLQMKIKWSQVAVEC